MSGEIVAVLAIAGVAIVVVWTQWRMHVRNEMSMRDMLKAVLATHRAPAAQALSAQMEKHDAEVDTAEANKGKPAELPRPRLAQ